MRKILRWYRLVKTCRFRRQRLRVYIPDYILKFYSNSSSFYPFTFKNLFYVKEYNFVLFRLRGNNCFRNIRGQSYHRVSLVKEYCSYVLQSSNLITLLGQLKRKKGWDFWGRLNLKYFLKIFVVFIVKTYPLISCSRKGNLIFFRIFSAATITYDII